MDLFSYESAETLYQTLFKLYKKDEARRCISLIKLLYNYENRLNLFTKKNPFSCLRIKTAKPTKLYMPKEDVDALISKAQEMNLLQVKLAIELNHYFSQRPTDILKLRKEHIYQKYGYRFFEIQQALIPPFLLEEVLKKDDFIITNKHNKPYKVTSFNRIFKKVNDVCGFNYTFRLFRHTGSTAYMEAGKDSNNIISLTDHPDEKMFNHVYKSPTESLALNTLNRRLMYEKNKKP